MEVRLRDATAADASSLVELVVGLNEGLGWERCTFTADHFLRDGLGPDRWFDTIVAEHDDRLVGYAMLHRSYDTENATRGSYLTDLYVVPEGRGQRVGWKLLAAAAARTREWGGDVMWWVTTADNAEGKAFYRRVSQAVQGVEVWVAAGSDFERLASEVGRP